MKTRIIRVCVRLCVLTGMVLASAEPRGFAQSTFTFMINPTNNTFTYTDAERSFTGIFVKPAGKGPFPALIINHGQGGSPLAYSLPKAREMAPWGLVAIGPALTHAGGPGVDTSPEGSGSSPENVARGEACLAALARLGYVDMSRVAVWGHSKGAYATIGQVAAMGSRIRAAGMSAGGIVPGTVADGAHAAPPTEGEAEPTVTPFVMFHGTTDTAVEPSFSERFKALLDEKGVPNERHTYDTSGLSADLRHNLHKTPAFNADMLAKYRAWLTTHGVLSSPSSSDAAHGARPRNQAPALSSTADGESAPGTAISRAPSDEGLFPFPHGIYALGTARDNPATPEDERLAGIRAYDFVSGFTLRLAWRDIDDGRGGYRFDVIDDALRRTAAIGQRINLEILPLPPASVVAAAEETYVDERGETTPVPWEPALRRAHERFLNALASHVPPGTATTLASSPGLAAIDNSVPGFSQGLRDINRRLRDSPFYDRQSCIDAALAAVDAGRRAFPRHLGYLAFFAFDDGRGSERVDQVLIRNWDALYNRPGEPSLAFFIENLTDTGPQPLNGAIGAGNNLLDWSDRGGATMMQALTSWVQPFTGSPDAVASRNPTTGLALADGLYGTRFFELYVTDLDYAAAGGLDARGRPIAEDLRYWSALLK
jgi:dienelactone hydrolase